MMLPEWLTSNPGDVQGVIKTTERDETSILYSVSVSLRSLAQHAFEEGEDRRGVWQRCVEFGQSQHHTGGGRAFVQASQEQEEVAREISALVWPKEEKDDEQVQ